MCEEVKKIDRRKTPKKPNPHTLRNIVKDHYRVSYDEVFNRLFSVKSYLTNLKVDMYNRGLSSNPLQVSKSQLWVYLYDKYSDKVIDLFKEKKTGYFNYTSALHLEYILTLVKDDFSKMNKLEIQKDEVGYYLELLDFIDDLEVILTYFKNCEILESLKELTDNRVFGKTPFRFTSPITFKDLDFYMASYNHINRPYNFIKTDFAEPCDVNIMYETIEYIAKNIDFSTINTIDQKIDIWNLRDTVRYLEKLKLTEGWTFLEGKTREEEIRYIPLIEAGVLEVNTKDGKKVTKLIRMLIKTIGARALSETIAPIIEDALMEQIESIGEDETLAYFSNITAYKQPKGIIHPMYMTFNAIDYDNDCPLPFEANCYARGGIYTRNYDLEGYQINHESVKFKIDGVKQDFYEIMDIEEEWAVNFRKYFQPRPIVENRRRSKFVEMYNRIQLNDTTDLEFFNLSKALGIENRSFTTHDFKRVYRELNSRGHGNRGEIII